MSRPRKPTEEEVKEMLESLPREEREALEEESSLPMEKIKALVEKAHQKYLRDLKKDKYATMPTISDIMKEESIKQDKKQRKGLSQAEIEKSILQDYNRHHSHDRKENESEKKSNHDDTRKPKG